MVKSWENLTIFFKNFLKFFENIRKFSLSDQESFSNSVETSMRLGWAIQSSWTNGARLRLTRPNCVACRHFLSSGLYCS